MTVVANHIAILVCDTPIPGISVKYGDFGNNCRDLLLAGEQSPFPSICYRVCTDDIDELEGTYRVLEAGIGSGTVRGLLLTGSRADCFDSLPWIQRLDTFLLNVAFRAAGLPIVGICFGHQIIGKNLGSRVGRNIDQGWELGTTQLELNSKFPLMKGTVLSMSECHRDVVFDVPGQCHGSEFHTLGLTSSCAVQGLFSTGGKMKVLTFQGHPEFHPDLMVEICRDVYEQGGVSRATFEQSVEATRTNPNQGVEIGAVIGKFFRV